MMLMMVANNIISLAFISLFIVLVTVEGKCPTGFHGYRQSCYWFSTITGDFAFARGVCRHLGSNLVVITSKSADEFLRGYALKRGKAGAYYLGGSDLDLEGIWKWEGGQRMTYTNWGPGGPDNSGGKEHCVALWRSNAYEWNDCPCDFKLNFICERKQ